jgi:O-antigen ligase
VTDPRRLASVGFVLIAACLGAVQFSLFLAQSVLFSAAAVVWLIVAVREGRRPAAPAFFLPLVVYAGLTLVSAAFSVDPLASVRDSRQLVLFLMVPIVARFAQGSRAMKVVDVVIAVGAGIALVGIVQWTMFGYDSEANRPASTLSTYMTYSGVLMLATCAAVARLTFYRHEWIWPTIALPALIVALGATLTRNAWIGTGVALTVLLAIRRWQLAVIVPVATIILVAVAPAGIRNRVFSIVDPNHPSNVDRVAMMHVGASMVRAHPLFGVGPEMVQREYVTHRPAVYTNETNPHLHNVPVQIAAERGLPALAAWLWFVVIAGRDLFRQAIRGPHRAVAAAGAASLVAMLAAGLFEYNFGDSEFLMLFLGLITLPFAAAQDGGAAAAPGRPRSANGAPGRGLEAIAR